MSTKNRPFIARKTFTAKALKQGEGQWLALVVESLNLGGGTNHKLGIHPTRAKALIAAQAEMERLVAKTRGTCPNCVEVMDWSVLNYHLTSFHGYDASHADDVVIEMFEQQSL